MRRFSVSTLLGLALGVLLAGYAVFAFQAPTAAPPGGNVPTPLNTGSADQTKTGGTLNAFGLWVNQSLGVTGGATFGGLLNLQGNRVTNVGAPTSAGDVTTKGYEDARVSAPISTGLYGLCIVDDNFAPVNDYCDAAFSPASCINHYTPSAQCVCPSGYSVVSTGTEADSYGTIRWYSCYKN